MKIIFRVDASNNIGTGHVMRCLTLAEALRQGNEVEFITRETTGNLAAFIESKGYKTHLLAANNTKNDDYCFHAKWLESSWEKDAEETASLAKGADWLVIDHYAIDERWEKTLRPHVRKIMVIDDLADRKHDADLLLDQNYYLNFETRYNGLVPTSCRLLLSPKYALLRDEFAAARKRMKRQFTKLQNILVFFSGVDATNETGKVLEQIHSLPQNITAVIGASNPHYSELVEKYGNHKNIAFLKGVSNMAELMALADLAIGAGGSTSWERAALGLPTIAWSIAENQNQILEDLNKSSLIILSSPEKVADEIRAMTPEMLRDLSERTAKMVDAEGTRKVAFAIEYNLRKAKPEDSRAVFDIRNKPEIRKVSLQNEELVFENHDEWFKCAIINPDLDLLVLENTKGIAGVIRFDYAEDSAEISIYLDTPYFGKGLGKLLLEAGENFARATRKNLKLFKAQVLENNLKSQALFFNLGYERQGRFFSKKL